MQVSEDVKQQMMAKLAKEKLDSIASRRVVKLDTRDGFRYKLEDGAWLLVRFSGTEPLVRIYAESSRQDDVQKLLEIGQGMAGAG